MDKIILFILLKFLLVSYTVNAQESTCYGTTKQGRLENGVKLPDSGTNFKSYGVIPELVGMTYVHSIVRNVIIESYKNLENLNPDKVFKYAETGFKTGGQFSPHKTHQNGLSVDFMVPVLNKNNKSVYIPTNVLNKYGYNVNFDSNGRNKDYRIDFEALAVHIVTLHKIALKNGIDLKRVIFAPDLQYLLYATQYGDYIKTNVKIPVKKSWVRHDEHFHVDFKVKCKLF